QRGRLWRRSSQFLFQRLLKVVSRGVAAPGRLARGVLIFLSGQRGMLARSSMRAFLFREVAYRERVLDGRECRFGRIGNLFGGVRRHQLRRLVYAGLKPRQEIT